MIAQLSCIHLSSIHPGSTVDLASVRDLYWIFSLTTFCLFSLVVLFYVRDSLIKQSRDGKEIAYLLKQKLSDNFFEFRMQEVEPYGMLCILLIYSSS